MRISDWSLDVCSSDLETEAAYDVVDHLHEAIKLYLTKLNNEELDAQESGRCVEILNFTTNLEHIGDIIDKNLMELASKKIKNHTAFSAEGMAELQRSEEHTSELQSLMRNSYAVFCLNKKKETRKLKLEHDIYHE